MTASAAYGIDTEGLEALLNYLEVDEARHFTLNEAYLALLTVSELESLAEDVGLKKAMGERYAKAKAGKRGEFIQALLAVEGFSSKPFWAPRWEVEGSDTYGSSSPGLETLADVRQLQLEVLRHQQAIDYGYDTRDRLLTETVSPQPDHELHLRHQRQQRDFCQRLRGVRQRCAHQSRHGHALAQRRQHLQIGRASCRERVSSPV